MTTNQIFAKMLDWIFANTSSKKNIDVAQKAGIDKSSISRIMHGRVKSVKQDTLRAINAAYGNVFNPEWMRGQSDVMLVADLTPTATEANNGLHQFAQPSTAPDMSSMINAIIAANDQAIMSLKRELAVKQEMIDELRGRIADKDEIIRQKDLRISTLEQQVLGLHVEKGASTGLSPLGVAESDPVRTSR